MTASLARVLPSDHKATFNNFLAEICIETLQKRINDLGFETKNNGFTKPVIIKVPEASSEDYKKFMTTWAEPRVCITTLFALEFGLVAGLPP